MKNNEKKAASVHRLADAIGDARDEYIEAAAPGVRPMRGQILDEERPSLCAKRLNAAAACLLLLLSGTLLLPRVMDRFTAIGNGTASADTTAHETVSFYYDQNTALPDGTEPTSEPSLNIEYPKTEEDAVEEAVESAPKEALAAPTQEESIDEEAADASVNENTEPNLFIPPRTYHDTSILTPQVHPVWNWEDLTDHERYSLFTLNGELYHAVGEPINGVYRDAALGTGTALGHDAADGYREYKHDLNAFSIQGIADNRFIAVYLPGEESDYLFRKAAAEPPATLGALIDAYTPAEYLTFDYWHENGDTDVCYEVRREMLTLLWESDSAAADAPYVEDAFYVSPDADAVTFSVSSRVYGIEDRTLTLTADGYLHTNAFDYAYTYRIGADAAARLLAELRRDPIQTVIDPNADTLAGTVTAITANEDGTYTLILDDTAVCKNPADGLTYRVLLTDLMQTRYLKNNFIREGDLIRLTYERAIHRESLLVDSVTDIHRVTLVPENAIMPR